MRTISYKWTTPRGDRSFEMVRVEGTNGRPYSFGTGTESFQVEVREFWIATVPVTQAFWMHLFGTDESPAVGRGDHRPLENISWEAIMQPGGFIERINSSKIRETLCVQASLAAGSFRLPSETEWEYAARGGPQWGDGFRYSGSDDIDRVAWYDRKDGDHTHDVARKQPNQLGIYDMSGNVWEWCQDTFSVDFRNIPTDGSALVCDGDERVLRGGCFHNWAIHCTVSKRYHIAREFNDGCIGLRLVLSNATC